MVLMTIILKEYLESRHRDRCVPSPTRENRQLAPKGLGGLAVNMVIMTMRDAEDDCGDDSDADGRPEDDNCHHDLE